MLNGDVVVVFGVDFVVIVVITVFATGLGVLFPGSLCRSARGVAACLGFCPSFRCGFFGRFCCCFFFKQSQPVGYRDLVVVGVDLVECEEAVAVAAWSDGSTRVTLARYILPRNCLRAADS